jgi:hypothetical protein
MLEINSNFYNVFTPYVIKLDNLPEMKTICLIGEFNSIGATQYFSYPASIFFHPAKSCGDRRET